MLPVPLVVAAAAVPGAVVPGRNLKPVPRACRGSTRDAASLDILFCPELPLTAAALLELAAAAAPREPFPFPLLLFLLPLYLLVPLPKGLLGGFGGS